MCLDLREDLTSDTNILKLDFAVNTKLKSKRMRMSRVKMENVYFLFLPALPLIYPIFIYLYVITVFSNFTVPLFH